MSANAFSPQGNTAALAVTATSTSTPIQVLGSVRNATQHMLTNLGPNTCYLAWGTSTSLVAAIPAAGTPANGIPIASGEILVLTFQPNSYFAAICASTETASLFLTPGEGV